MRGQNQLLDNMLRAAETRLAGRDPMKIARNADVRFEGGAFCFRSLGREVRISHPQLEVAPDLNPWQRLTLLHYLDLADGVPLAHRPMPFAEYRDGMVRGGGFDRDAEATIRDVLGKIPPEQLVRRCLELGAEFVPSNADLCARFDFAPRYPVWLKLWLADEEFPASGRLFVDERAEHYLTIEDAVTVGSLLLRAVPADG